MKKVLEVKILTPQQKCKKGDLEFHRSVIPIQTRGADYAPRTTASPPGFKKLSTPLKPIISKDKISLLLNEDLTFSPYNKPLVRVLG